MAEHPYPVLITGESGVGKELIAETLHGVENDAPFVAANCAGFPDTLFESLLFGHLKGTFTGATTDKAGLIDAARGGTLFLDEIGELPLTQQAKLLRVLQSKRFYPLGAGEPRLAECRFIFATNRDLVDECKRGAFREDLLFRISDYHVHIPPLRDRPADVPLIVKDICQREGWTDYSHITFPASIYTPGNVRALRQVLLRCETLGIDIEDYIARHA